MNLKKIAILGAGVLAVVFPLQSQTVSGTHSSGEVAACVLPKGRDVLLKLMECCTKDLKSNVGCREYDPVNRYVIIKDNAVTKPQGYLLVPTVKITGIDDKRIFAAPYVNLWANAWDQSERYPGWGDHRIGMAINSAHARAQDQLHVHIACIDAKVAQVLDEKAKDNEDGKEYTVALPPENNVYTVVTRNDLTDHESPFWVARESSREQMANKSVAVVKSKEPGRYFVLTSVYKDGKGGAAEELLDQTCGSTTP